MNVVSRSTFPWLAIVLVIVGLTIGYSSVVLMQEDAFAATRSCPNSCKGEDCTKRCDSKECENGNCPGCIKATDPES